MNNVVPFVSPPPRPQVERGGGDGPSDGDMEARVRELEKTMTDVRERLAKIDGRLEHTATKNDVSQVESTLLKWFIGTALALASLAFVAAKFIH